MRGCTYAGDRQEYIGVERHPDGFFPVGNIPAVVVASVTTPGDYPVAMTFQEMHALVHRVRHWKLTYSFSYEISDAGFNAGADLYHETGSGSGDLVLENELEADHGVSADDQRVFSISAYFQGTSGTVVLGTFDRTYNPIYSADPPIVASDVNGRAVLEILVSGVDTGLYETLTGGSVAPLLTFLFEAGSVIVDSTASGTSITVALDAHSIPCYYEPSSAGPPAVTRSATLSLAAHKYWTYGGIYDEDTGARI